MRIWEVEMREAPELNIWDTLTVLADSFDEAIAKTKEYLASGDLAQLKLIITSCSDRGRVDIE